MTTAERITDTERQIREADGRIQRLRSDLGTVIGDLRADVKSAQTHLSQNLQLELSRLEAQRAAEAAAQKKRGDKLRSDFERDEAMRKTKMGNRAKQIALRLRDAAVEFGPHRAAIATDAVSEADLIPGTQVRELVSVGTIRTGASSLDRDLPEVPALVPLIDAGHLIVESPSGTSDRPEPTFQALMTSLVAQIYASAPPGQMVVTVFNPRSSKVLAGFRPTGAETAGLLRVLAPTREALEKSLEEHLHFTQRAESSIGTYASMGELVRSTGQHEHQYHALVILDGPVDWSQKSVDLLEKLMASGSKAGMSVLMHRDPDASPLDRIDITRLDKYASTLLRRGGTWMLTVPDATTQPVSVAPIDAVSPSAQGRLMQLIVRGAETGALPSIPFNELIERGPGTTEHGMKVTMGKKGTQVTDFVLGDTGQNIQNILVGGRAGSGKTNLLKVMIYSLAARYPRDELELFLLDFKEGGDFMPFAGTDTIGALPNVSMVSRDCDPAFGIETLRYFAREMARRANLTSDNNVSNIWNLRERTGIVLPRWVLVIDEFQGLFSGPTYQEATELLEDFVRKGRSFGLHVILATQTLSGVKFAGDKDKAIFENISGRVVLQLGPGEFTRFMESGNDEGDQLRYRGQAIFNPMGGRKSENQLFVVAYADSKDTDALQDDLYREYIASADVGSYEPYVYRGDSTVTAAQLIEENGAPESWRDDEEIDEHDGDVPAWYGRVNSIERPVAAAPLTPVAGSHLLFLGGDEKTMSSAIGTLQTAVLSAVAAENEGIDVIVFESLIRKYRRGALIEEWLDTLAALGANVVRYDADTAEQFVHAVLEANTARKRTIVAMLGAENSDLGTIADENGRWREAIRSMPRNNVNLLGHWSDLRDIPGDKYSLKSDYKTMLFFGKNAQIIVDATSIAKQDVPPLSNTRTVVFSAASSQDGITTVTSLEPLTPHDLAAFRSLSRRSPGSVLVGGEPVPGTAAADATAAQFVAPAHVPTPTATMSPGVAPEPVVEVVPVFLDLLPSEQTSCIEGARAVIGAGASGTVSVTLGGPAPAHLLVTGRPFSGTGAFVERMVHALAAQHAASEVRIDLIDSDEEGDFPELHAGSLPQLANVMHSSEESEISGVLDACTEEIVMRLEKLESVGAGDYGQLRARGEEAPRRVVIWNAFGDALTPALAEQIEYIAQTGGLVGVHLVLSDTAPVSEHAALLPNLFASSSRALFSVLEDESTALIGSLAAARLVRKKQVLLATGQDPAVVSAVPTVEDSDLASLRTRLGGTE